MKKNNLIILLQAVLVLALISLGVWFFVFKETPKKVDVVKYNQTNSLVSNDYREVVSRFIEKAGTMGTFKDVETLKQTNDVYQNKQRRKESYYYVKGMIIDGSKLKDNGQDSYIDNSVEFQHKFYKVNKETINVSNPIKEYKTKVKSTQGEFEFESIDVLVDFDSNLITYRRPTDSSYDGTFFPSNNFVKVRELSITLINNDGYWYISQINNPDKVGDRLSVWDGKGSFLHGEIIDLQPVK